jgi:hypothetical protein
MGASIRKCYAVGNPVTLYDHRGGAGSLDGALVDAEGLMIWIARRAPAASTSIRVVRSSSASNSTGCVSPPPGKEWMAQAGTADLHCGRTFILNVGAVGRPEPRVRLS